jgi:SAM-dependent methyltransferase
MGYPSARDYRRWGETFLAFLKADCSLLPSHAVLDIGCGSGIVAASLTRYLSAEAQGRYEGFDVGSELIAWCRTHITTRYPHFRFRAADIYNGRFNPRGKIPAPSYRFEYPDGVFDVSFAKSVFTHLLPLDAEHYLAETARVTRKGGAFLATFFLLNPDSRARVDRGLAAIDFKPVDAVHSVRNPDAPEAIVAYDHEFVKRLFAEHGFDVRSVRLGLWTQKKTPAPEYQDFIVGIKQ